MATVIIGFDNHQIGTVSAQEENGEIQYTGKVGSLKALIHGLQRGPLYRNLTNQELIGQLPNILDGRSWARFADEETNRAG